VPAFKAVLFSLKKTCIFIKVDRLRVKTFIASSMINEAEMILDETITFSR
jgi:hypothetical protein